MFCSLATSLSVYLCLFCSIIQMHFELEHSCLSSILKKLSDLFLPILVVCVCNYLYSFIRFLTSFVSWPPILFLFSFLPLCFILFIFHWCYFYLCEVLNILHLKTLSDWYLTSFGANSCSVYSFFGSVFCHQISSCVLEFGLQRSFLTGYVAAVGYEDNRIWAMLFSHRSSLLPYLVILHLPPLDSPVPTSRNRVV